MKRQAVRRSRAFLAIRTWGRSVDGVTLTDAVLGGALLFAWWVFVFAWPWAGRAWSALVGG